MWGLSLEQYHRHADLITRQIATYPGLTLMFIQRVLEQNLLCPWFEPLDRDGRGVLATVDVYRFNTDNIADPVPSNYLDGFQMIHECCCHRHDLEQANFLVDEPLCKGSSALNSTCLLCLQVLCLWPAGSFASPCDGLLKLGREGWTLRHHG